MAFNQLPINVSSEIGTLRRILIHSPDGGIGKILPSKFREWLYDDTVHLEDMRNEYDEYIKTLLYFLDPEKIETLKAHKAKGEGRDHIRNFVKPDHPDFFNSDKVLEAQKLLADILFKYYPKFPDQKSSIRTRLIAAVCAVEGCSYETEQRMNNLGDHELAKVLISGVWPKADPEEDEQFIFPPLPNFVFTRDIGIVVNNHLLLSRFAKQARKRESILARFIAMHFLFKDDADKVFEVTEGPDFCLMDDDEKSDNVVTYEGGDIMMISPNHLLIGVSERTSPNASNELVHKLFSRPEIGIERVSVVKIPPARGQMHIDTIFTQVKRNLWVIYGPYAEQLQAEQKDKRINYTNQLRYGSGQVPSKEVEVVQFYKPTADQYDSGKNYVVPDGPTKLQELLTYVSMHDFNCRASEVDFIYSAGGVFPYDEIEQWTDSCNLLALKEGVVIGYDRNDRTIDQFEKRGFRVITARNLFDAFETSDLSPENISDTLILLSSSELSRGRGGSHCMSMPLLRDVVSI